MIDRRTFLGTLAGGLLAAPMDAQSQQTARLFRVIGWLHPSGAFGSSFDAFRLRLGELGWIEGRNIAIVVRGAGGNLDQLPVLAAELAGLGVEVIVTASMPATLAAGKATTTIPVVMAGTGTGNGLVELGLIKTLARPGTNVTGLTNNPGVGFYPKMVQLLKEVAPGVSRLAVLWNPGAAAELGAIKAAASALGITVVDAEARSAEGIPIALAAAVEAGADGLYCAASPINTSRGRFIVDFARTHRLPSIAGDREFVAAGGLLSYWTNWTELRRRSADYVDKILRGAEPADLAVEQPSKFELVINLKTAQAIGISIRPSLLLRADEVIK
jgi:putative ABC transport system substrate-binding protein